jgi:hypothetical protein
MMILSSFGANGNKKVEKTLKIKKNDNFFFKNRKSLKNGAAATRHARAASACCRWKMAHGERWLPQQEAISGNMMNAMLEL